MKLTDEKPKETGWYWFQANKKSPQSIRSGSLAVVLVGEWLPTPTQIEGSSLCVRFTYGTYLVSRMGGLWSEKLEEPEV